MQYSCIQFKIEVTLLISLSGRTWHSSPESGERPRRAAYEPTCDGDRNNGGARWRLAGIDLGCRGTLRDRRRRVVPFGRASRTRQRPQKEAILEQASRRDRRGLPAHDSQGLAMTPSNPLASMFGRSTCALTKHVHLLLGGMPIVTAFNALRRTSKTPLRRGWSPGYGLSGQQGP